MRNLRGRLAAVALGSLLAACSAPSPPAPSPTLDTEAIRLAACARAAEDLISAVRQFVAPYNDPEPGSASASASASPSPSPSPSASPSESSIQPALQTAQETVRANRCDQKRFAADLEAGLAQVATRGAVAAAVLRRLSAGLTGRMPEAAVRRTVSPADDLHTAIAESPAGSTLALDAGTYRLRESLVLLDGVSLVGEGAGRTELFSTAPEAAVLVLTADLVVINDLTLRRSTRAPGSGIVAGPAAVLALSDLTITGARAGQDRQGGAAVHLSAEGDDAAGRGTTLEVTDTTFADNEWAGIAASGGHVVSIVGSTFRDNGQCGVCFLDGGAGSVTRSRFIDNTIGVAVTGDTRPTIAANRIRGGEVGVQANQTVKPVLDRNIISGASKAALIFSDRTAGTIRRTRCAGVPYGLVLGGEAAPTLIDNDCTLARGR